MKLQIDTTEGKVCAQLGAVDRRGNYAVPLVRAICRDAHCETITHEGAARFHYFKFDDDRNTATVEFAFHNRQDVNNSELVAALVGLSQQWLSLEIERLTKVNEDLETLKAVIR